MKLTTIVASLSLVLPPLAAQSDAGTAEHTIALQGAKVFVGTGSFDNLTILVRAGKILAIGKNVSIPADAESIDCTGSWITPGLIDANTSLGLPSAQENEESSEVTPQMRALEAIDPSAPAFRRACHEGVTTAYISPGDKNVFGGLGVVYKTAGTNRVVKEDAGLRMTLGMMPGRGNSRSPSSMYFRRPQNRMGVIWEVRKTFYDAMEARETRIGPTRELSEGTKVLIQALDRKLDVRTTARADQDIRTAIRLANEFGIKIVIDGATEAYYALDYIIAAKVPVVAEAPSLPTAGDTATPHLDTLKLLSEANVPVAIQTGQGIGALPLIREAGFAVRGGMSREAALRAITSVPAKILGVDDRVGSLEKGKDADIVVWSHHPLNLGSRTTQVFVDGKLVKN